MTKSHRVALAIVSSTHCQKSPTMLNTATERTGDGATCLCGKRENWKGNV